MRRVNKKPKKMLDYNSFRLVSDKIEVYSSEIRKNTKHQLSSFMIMTCGEKSCSFAGYSVPP
jgi:hypothetical protein